MADSINFFNLAFVYSGSFLAQATEPSLLTTLASEVLRWSLVAIGIGFVVFVHELGHFLAAKWCGVKVEKFYVGFDVPIKIGPIQLPRTLGKFRYGETEYGIGTIPLGGYVKMLGQDDDPRKAEAEAQRIRLSNGKADATGDEGKVTLDPRSFPAKPVWQRMIIISAGVVMNLITGVMFAMVAFFLGVPYTPAVIGDVSPGGPAYQEGIEPGGRVVSVGDLPRDEKLHFRDMRYEILTEAMAAPDEPVNINLDYPDGQREYSLVTTPLPQEPSQRMIGILMPQSNKLRKTTVAVTGSIAATVLNKDDAGAQVVALDGIKAPGDGSDDNVEASIWMRKYLQEHATQPVTLTLRREDKSEIEVTIPPQKLMMPGVRFAVGPVKALIKDGVAVTAGVQIGDVLVAVDGNRAIDAFDLPVMLANASTPTTLTFQRGAGDKAEDVDLTVTPSTGSRAVEAMNETSDIIALNRFDFAYQALPIVARVEPGATAADPEKAIREGDVMRKFIVRWPGGIVPEFFAKSAMKEAREKLTEGWEFSDEYPLVSFISLLQLLPEGTELAVAAARNDNIVQSTLKLQRTEIVTADRGIGFDGVERIHYATSFGEAFSLGVREAKRKLGDVFGFLAMLVQGKVQAKQVGGPIRIFSVAGQETSRGLSPLLMFLTMLSMNLAILNFLPIPALDGGHMMFLTAEAVLGRPVDENLQMKLTMVGVLALLALMLFAFVNDISQVL